MQRTEPLLRPALPAHSSSPIRSTRSAPTDLPEVSKTWLAIGRGALVSLVLVYLATVLIAPLVALLYEAGKVGIGAAFLAVTTPAALDALQMTLVLMAIALVVNALVGTLGAIAIVRHRFVGRAALSALFDLPLAVSPVMIGLAFLLLLGRNSPLSPAFDALDIKVVFSFPGLVIGTLFVTLPYTVREVAYVLEEIGTSEEEAATTLGASPGQTFWRVTLPNIRVALGEFGAVLVLGGSISGKTQTATTFIHDAIEERQLAGAYGMALVLALMSIVLLVGLEWVKGRRQAALSKATT
jgi:sulfate/thiosulfate transport system permease protein